jgi:hypothetical protein
MLLCGADLVESFLKPGVWKPEQVDAIFREHGVVCISRSLVLIVEGAAKCGREGREEVWGRRGGGSNFE